MKWILIIASLFIMNAYALDMQSPEIKSSMAPAGKEAQTIDKEKTINAPSIENRKNSKYQMTVGVGREYIATPLTFSLGYFLTSDDLLLVRYSNFNGRVDDDKEAAKLRALTIGYRKFLGNSFNIMPSIYYRRNTGDYGKEGAFTVWGPNNVVYEDVGVGFRVGNEWQWENFTIGCDWFGINHTVHEIHHEESAVGIIDSVSLEKALTINVLSFYLGYSF